MASVDGNIEFDIPSNVKLHRRATTKLEDKLYNCVLQYLFNFIQYLNNQATVFQWSEKVGIMMIPKDVSGANINYVNLISNHGEIDLNIITKYE